ncbi:MAG: hypothetical protein SGI87_08080 [Flavobacteriales bacterium]|nr:hypothetical protein [Flavobacteriales bacterium]
MFTKKGEISTLLYPGAGGEHVQRVELNEKVNDLHAVLRGFDVSYDDDDSHLRRIQVSVWAIHTNGTQVVDVHFKVKFNDDSPHNDAIKASVQYLLIGEEVSNTRPTRL